MATAEKEVVEVTATELKQSLGKYLDMAENGKVVTVMRNGKRTAKLVDTKEDWKRTIDDLTGILAWDDDTWTAAAAARYFGIAEDDVTDEQLRKYYKTIEKQARLEYRLKKDLGMTVEEWEEESKREDSH